MKTADKDAPIDEKLSKLAEMQVGAMDASPSEMDAWALFHELQVHQIELEMQNKELRQAQEELELSRNTYTEFYDFAPVGYFIFDTAGLIREVNLAGAKLLGAILLSLLLRTEESPT